MSAMIRAIALGLIRHGLTFAGGWLVAQGYMSASDETQAIAAAVTLIGIAWSVLQKWASVQKWLASRAEVAAVPSPPGTTADSLNRAELAALGSPPAAPR